MLNREVRTLDTAGSMARPGMAGFRCISARNNVRFQSATLSKYSSLFGTVCSNDQYVQ